MIQKIQKLFRANFFEIYTRMPQLFVFKEIAQNFTCFIKKCKKITKINSYGMGNRKTLLNKGSKIC